MDFAVTFFGREVELDNLILSSNSEVYVSLSNKSWDIRCRQKDESKSVVSDERNVEPVVAVELYIYKSRMSFKPPTEK